MGHGFMASLVSHWVGVSRFVSVCQHLSIFSLSPSKAKHLKNLHHTCKFVATQTKQSFLPLPISSQIAIFFLGWHKVRPHSEDTSLDHQTFSMGHKCQLLGQKKKTQGRHLVTLMYRHSKEGNSWQWGWHSTDTLLNRTDWLTCYNTLQNIYQLC